MKNLLSFAVSILTICGISAQDGWSSANPERFNKIDFSQAKWHENFSSKEIPVTVEYCQGACGSIKLLPKMGRNQAPALQLIKSNHKGYMVVRFKQTIPVKKGEKLQFNSFYQGIKSSPQYSLAMLRLQQPNQSDFKLFRFPEAGGTNGGERLQEVICTAPQTWERKFTQRQALEDTTMQPVIVISGAPSETIWSDCYVENDNISADNWDRNLNRRKPVDRSSEMISLQELEKKLASDIDHTGKVVTINGKSRLLIDGKITPPIINGPYGVYVVGKTYSNAKDFGNAGVNLVKLGIRLGHGKNSHPGCWTGKNQLDVSGAVDLVRRTLRLDPNAKIILSITLWPYWQFTLDYPGEAWIGEKGFPLAGNGIHLPENPTQKFKNNTYYIWPSYHSEILLDLYKQQITKIIHELKRTGLSKAVVGVHIGGGHDNQMTVVHFDYSAPAIKAFRRYLREKYKSNEALQKAWKISNVTFDTAEAPKKYYNYSDCLNPETEQNKIDFYHFSKSSSWQVASEVAQHVKNIIGKDIFSMRWCMGAYDGSMANSLDFDDFLTRQKFDVLVAQAAYNRRPPASACAIRLPLDSFHHYGKLFVNEFDIRTWNAAPSWEKEIMSITWGLMLDPQMWQASNRKLAGSMFAHDMGFWYLDMAPGWFDHKEIMKDIKETAQLAKTIINTQTANWHPDVAFVADSEGMFLRNVPSPKWMFDVSALIPYQTNLLGLAGVPYNFYTLNDLMNRPKLAQEYKVLIFAGMFKIDQKRKDFLEKLKNSNRTLVFLSGTGRLSKDNGTGMIQVTATPKNNINHWVEALPGVKENMLSIWMIKKMVSLNAKPEWYDHIPIVHAVNLKPNDKVLARFTANNQAAVVERDNETWKAIYIGEAGGLTPEYLNRIAKDAGAYRMSDPGFQCETNGSFISIHAMSTKQATFKLPFKADVVNLYNGKSYKGITQLTLNVEAGSTYWFLLKK